MCGCQLSEVTVLQWSELAAERLAPTKDFWDLSQCDWGLRFLPHPQLSVDDVEARILHALCSDRGLPQSPFTGRLGA